MSKKLKKITALMLVAALALAFALPALAETAAKPLRRARKVPLRRKARPHPRRLRSLKALLCLPYPYPTKSRIRT